MRVKPSLKAVSDDDLLRHLSELLKQSRRCEADLVAHIGEVDERRLYAREATPSMFVYCTQRLHFSEQEAYLRIAVARASREHPILLEMLRDGRLHLSGIARLAPHLTGENSEKILERAAHKSHRQILELIAELQPKPSAPAAIRKLPARRAVTTPVVEGRALADQAPADAGRLESGTEEVDENGGEIGRTPESGLCAHRVGEDTGELLPGGLEGVPKTAPMSAARPVRVEPLAPGRYKIQFTASAELRDKLERLQALMRCSVPDGDLAQIIDAAVTEKLERLEARRFARINKARKSLAETDMTPKSRHIPAAVRRAVYERDRGRCTYRDTLGRRCTRRHDIEFHHDGTPFGKQGAHSPENIRLMCKAHNGLRAEQEYGKEVMARFRRTSKQVSTRTSGRSQSGQGQSSRASRGADLVVGAPSSGLG